MLPEVEKKLPYIWRTPYLNSIVIEIYSYYIFYLSGVIGHRRLFHFLIHLFIVYFIDRVLIYSAFNVAVATGSDPLLAVTFISPFLFVDCIMARHFPCQASIWFPFKCV